MDPDAQKDAYMHGGRHRYDDGRGSRYALPDEVTSFSHTIDDLEFPERELTEIEVQLTEVMAEISALAELPISALSPHMLDRLTILTAEQVLLHAQHDLETTLEADPAVAQVVEEWLPDTHAAQALELWLALRLDDLEAHGVPVDELMYEEAKLLAQAMAFANDTLDADDLLEVAEAMVAEIEAQKQLIETQAQVLEAALV